MRLSSGVHPKIASERRLSDDKGMPFLARRTCISALTKSMADHMGRMRVPQIVKANARKRFVARQQKMPLVRDGSRL
jgi:hypothetical protein